MKATIISLIMIAALAMCAVAASAQHADEGPAPTWVADAGAGDIAIPAVAEPAASPEPDIIAELAEVKRALDDLRGQAGPGLLLWIMLIGAVVNVLLSAIKEVMKLTPRGKRYLSWAALGLGVIGGFAGAYTGSWVTALVYGAGPPVAVILQELQLGRVGDMLIAGLRLLAAKRT